MQQYKKPSLISVSEGLLHVTCAEVMMPFVSSVVQLWKLVELPLRTVFSFFFLSPPNCSPNTPNNGVNCGMTEKQHLTSGMNLRPLYINFV